MTSLVPGRQRSHAMAAREQNVCFAKLPEQDERFDEMDGRCGTELPVEKRNLRLVSRRAAWRIIFTCFQLKEKSLGGEENTTELCLMVEAVLRMNCVSFTGLLDCLPVGRLSMMADMGMFFQDGLTGSTFVNRFLSSSCL